MRFCTCGHTEDTHWADDMARLVSDKVPYPCHVKKCTCTKFPLRRPGWRRLLQGSA